jgi:hypothetical protein
MREPSLAKTLSGRSVTITVRLSAALAGLPSDVSASGYGPRLMAIVGMFSGAPTAIASGKRSKRWKTSIRRCSLRSGLREEVCPGTDRANVPRVAQSRASPLAVCAGGRRRAYEQRGGAHLAHEQNRRITHFGKVFASAINLSLAPWRIV